MDHATEVTGFLRIATEFPMEAMPPAARACAAARRKAVQQWKRTVVVPVVRAQGQT